MAAATSPAASNRFAPLASPPEASRSTSPTRPDASQPPRSASPPPPKLRHSIISRFRTYPTTWTYTQLAPRQLATCGFSCEPLKEGECFCPVCEERIDIPELISEGILTNNGLLGEHTEDCVLADTIFDMFNNAKDIYTELDQSLTQSLKGSSPTSSTQPPAESPQGLPPREDAAAIPSPASTRIPQALISPSRSSSSSRPSYAAVASCHCPTSPSLPLKFRQPSTKTPPKPITKPPPQSQRPAPRTTAMSSQRAPSHATFHTIANPATPSSTPTRHHTPHPSSPVLSIHDLERRFHRTSLLHRLRPNQTVNQQPSMLLPQLLYTVANLLESCISSDNQNTCQHHRPTIFNFDTVQRGLS